MKKLFALACLSLFTIACKKEDTRGVTYKAECQHCIITYTDGEGNDVTEAVNTGFEKRVVMHSGDKAAISVCGYNNPVGGSITDVQAHNGSAVWVYLDRNSWSEVSASTWGATLDSVQIGATTQYRKFYSDTCTAASVVVPER